MHPLIVFSLVFTLGMGTIFAFSSSHWLLAWMGLEMNTLAILPLMAQKHHPRAVEATIKYFLIQATAAAIILFASLTNAWLLGEWNISQLSHPLASTLVLLALALKMGLAPMHSWLPEVLQGLDLLTGLILSTWQKLAPFILLLQITPFVNAYLIVTLGLLSTLVGGWGGLNQTQLRKVLAYSSIAHFGWMLLVSQFAPSLAFFNLALYIFMTSVAFLTLKSFNCTSLKTLATSWTKAPSMATMFAPLLLSLGGLPPLSGFLPKWLVVFEMVKQDLAGPAALAALSALLSLYYYLRLSYAVALTSPPNTTTKSTPWRLASPQKVFSMTAALVLALGALPLAPTILAWFN